MDDLYIFIAAFITIAVFLVEMSMFGSFYGNEAKRDKKLKKRLQELKADKQNVSRQSIVKGEFEKEKSVLERIPFYRSVKELVIQSGSTISVGKIFLIQLLIGVIVGIVAFDFTQDVLIALVLSLGLSSLPYLFLMHKRKARTKKFDEQFGDATDIIIRALKAGHPFESALNLAAEELPNPVAEEFSITYTEIFFGIPVNKALQNMVARVPSGALKAMVTSVSIQKETGGNLAEILEKNSEVIREIHKFHRKLRTLSAEGRISSLVLAAIPALLALFYFVMFPDLMVYLTDYESGHDALTAAAIMYVVGFLWVKRVIKLEP